MFKCPKCHNEITGNIKTCPNCNFKLKITLEEYKTNELRVHGYYKDKVPRNNKLVQRFLMRNWKNLMISLLLIPILIC